MPHIYDIYLPSSKTARIHQQKRTHDKISDIHSFISQLNRYKLTIIYRSGGKYPSMFTDTELNHNY